MWDLIAIGDVNEERVRDIIRLCNNQKHNWKINLPPHILGIMHCYNIIN